jgi:hypothetical protein
MMCSKTGYTKEIKMAKSHHDDDDVINQIDVT